MIDNPNHEGTVHNMQFTLHMSESIKVLPPELQHPCVLELIKVSLSEDLTPDANLLGLFPHLETGDITSTATIPATTHLRGVVRAKGNGIIAGLIIAQVVFKMLDPEVLFDIKVEEGAPVQAGEVLVEVEGAGASLLAGERAALNFIGRLSGIATLTHRFVEAVRGTGATILDTRKTGPGLRMFDKYAVRMGGGTNHRMGLYDMVMIKDNHIDGSGSIEKAVARVREVVGIGYPIEVEVKDLKELEIALSLPVNRIMLDNMDLSTMRQAVSITDGRIPLEASGNVSLETVRDIAITGVDFISVGALTHSAPVFDISMRLT